jgi:hypothetical protein
MWWHRSLKLKPSGRRKIRLTALRMRGMTVNIHAPAVGVGRVVREVVINSWRVSMSGWAAI